MEKMKIKLSSIPSRQQQFYWMHIYICRLASQTTHVTIVSYKLLRNSNDIRSFAKP